MKPYPKYKPSNIIWLGDIPEHWKIKKLKFLSKVQFSGVDKKTKQDEVEILLCNYVDVFRNEYIDEKIEFMKATASKSEIEKFLIKEGDVIATKDSETPYEIAIPAYVKKNFNNVICGYHLAQVRADKKQIVGNFLFRLFQAISFNSQFVTQANGITRFGLSTSSFNSGLVPYPPTIEEQQELANFLDKKIKKIDKLIANKQKQIGLFKEEREVIINNAITQGINNKKRISTNNKFLPMIPESWSLKKFTFFAPIITCGLAATPEYTIEGIPFLSAQNVKGNKLILDKYNFISIEFHKQLTKNKQPLKDDILVTRVGAGIGDACIVDVDFEFSIYVSLTHIRVDPKQVLNKFIMYFFSTNYCKTLNTFGTVTGGGVGNLNVNNVRAYRIPIPNLCEQKRIVSFIDTETQRIDTVILKIEKDIELLLEYKAALISEAVTGKIDVREVELK